MKIPADCLLRLAELAQSEPDQCLSSAHVRELLRVSRSQWQRIRTRPDFLDPIQWGRRYGYPPGELLAYLHRYNALQDAKTLGYIARQRLRMGVVALVRLMKQPGAPKSVGMFRGHPAYDTDEVVAWVRQLQRFMKPPKDFAAPRKPRRIAPEAKRNRARG